MSEQRTSEYHARVEWLGPNDANQSRKSDKFYEITVTQEGCAVKEIRRWGKWGTEGQTKVINHYSLWSAVESAKKQLKKKRKKGYRDPVDALTRLAHQIGDE